MAKDIPTHKVQMLHSLILVTSNSLQEMSNKHSLMTKIMSDSMSNEIK